MTDTRQVLFATAALLFAAGSARADWLVTRDGARVETKGAWQVKGKQVVFTQPNGHLSALRLSEVDLDQSAKATAEAINPPASQPAAPEPPKKKPVLVLTDKDVGHNDQARDTAPKDAGDKDAAADKPAETGAVLVDTWEKVDKPDNGVEIFGVLKNTSKDTATDIAVSVKIFDEAGGLLATVDATVSSSVLPPGGNTNFRASFPGVLHFTTARFQVSNRALMSSPAEKPAAPPSSATSR